MPNAFTEHQVWALAEGTSACRTPFVERAEQQDMSVHRERTPSCSLPATSTHRDELNPFTSTHTRVRMQLLDDHLDSLPQLPLPSALHTLTRASASIVEVWLDELDLGQSQFGDIITLIGGAGLYYAGNDQQMYGDDVGTMSFDTLSVHHPACGGAVHASTQKGA